MPLAFIVLIGIGADADADVRAEVFLLFFDDAVFLYFVEVFFVTCAGELKVIRVPGGSGGSDDATTL